MDRFGDLHAHVQDVRRTGLLIDDNTYSDALAIEALPNSTPGVFAHRNVAGFDGNGHVERSRGGLCSAAESKSYRTSL